MLMQISRMLYEIMAARKQNKSTHKSVALGCKLFQSALCPINRSNSKGVTAVSQCLHHFLVSLMFMFIAGHAADKGLNGESNALFIRDLILHGRPLFQSQPHFLSARRPFIKHQEFYQQGAESSLRWVNYFWPSARNPDALTFSL
jgi:hypothetical protein